jgi:hypothetical protein
MTALEENMNQTGIVRWRVFVRWFLPVWILAAPVALTAGLPDKWIPARWSGGPLEVARRSGDKALEIREVREIIADWYRPATLDLLAGTPIDCLLLTFSVGADPALEREQQQLVRDYARRARERGIASLGLVYPGANAASVASAASEAELDGIVLEGNFPGAPGFRAAVESILSAENKDAFVTAVASPALVRGGRAPVLIAEGVPPGVGEAGDTITASPTSGMWIDSNLWLVRSLQLGHNRQPVWVSHRSGDLNSRGAYLKSIADAAAAGGRWILELDDSYRGKLLRRDREAMEVWRSVAGYLKFFEDHADWRSYSPFGNLAYVVDPTGQNLAVAEECLNLLTRHQVPYRVFDRAGLRTESLAGLRAVLAFDLAPPTEVERKILAGFAAEGGLVLVGPSWGSPPKEQSYTVVSAGRGEIAVYKNDYPKPESLSRDLNDLLSTGELGLSVFKAPSVLSSASTSDGGRRVLLQLINYADLPSDSIRIWLSGKFSAARLYAPETDAVDVPMRHSGSRTEITIPLLAVYGALLLE